MVAAFYQAPDSMVAKANGQIDLFAFKEGDRVRYIPPKQNENCPCCEDGTVARVRDAVIFVLFDGAERTEGTTAATLRKL